MKHIYFYENSDSKQNEWIKLSWKSNLTLPIFIGILFKVNFFDNVKLNVITVMVCIKLWTNLREKFAQTVESLVKKKLYQWR